MKRTKRKFHLIFLILVGVLVGIIFVEIALRIAGIQYPSFHWPDKYRGFANRPKAEGWIKEEGKAFIKINSAGLRGPEYAQEKPENTFRVAVLGDSFTAAFQVAFEETFCQVVQNSLTDCQPLKKKVIEVLNFGVNGYGTLQELLTLRHFVWQFSPDLVVLAFFIGNDINNNYRKLSGNDLRRPFSSLQDEELVLDDSFLNSDWYERTSRWWWKLLRKFKNNSRILQLIFRFMSKTRFSIADADIDKNISHMIYVEPVAEVWKQAWQVTEELILIMNKEVKKKEVKFLVVTLTTPLQADSDLSKRKKLAKKLKIKDLFYPDRRIKSIGERHGFPVLNLGKFFQENAEKNKFCLHGFKGNCDGHWNKKAHLLAGKLIARKICQLVLK